MPTELDTAELVGVLIETLLSGIAFVFGFRTHNLFRRRSRREGRQKADLLTVVLWILIALTTLYLIDGWYRIIVAFIHIQDRRTRIAFLGDYNYSADEIHNSWSNLVKMIVFTVETFICDFILAYRSYLVWKPYSKRVGIVPCVMSLFSLGFGLAVIITSPRDSNLFFKFYNALNWGFWISTLTTNATSTGLILIRLWISHRTRGNTIPSFSIRPIAIVLVQSGVLYGLLCVIVFVLRTVKSNLHMTIIDIFPPINLFLFSFVLLQLLDSKEQIDDEGQVSTFRANRFRPTFSLNELRFSKIETDGDVESGSYDYNSRGSHNDYFKRRASLS